MAAALNAVQAVIWFWLEAVLITRLLGGEWRRFPLVFAYAVTDFLLAVAQFPTIWAITFHATPSALSWSARVYQWGELLMEFFTFVLVINLIFSASAHLQSRRVMRFVCVVGAMLFVGISFRAHYDPRLTVGRWMAPWTRDLNFGASILDIALWTLLLAQRRGDSRLLLLSGALGVQFTGAAMGHAMRSMATHYHAWPAIAGGKVVVITETLRVYMWARAFRPLARATPAATSVDG